MPALRAAPATTFVTAPRLIARYGALTHTNTSRQSVPGRPPVNVIQPQPGGFASTQPQAGQDRQDREVPPAHRRTQVAGREQDGYLPTSQRARTQRHRHPGHRAWPLTGLPDHERTKCSPINKLYIL